MIRKCSKCGIDRKYTTKLGYERSINTLCRSCSNSISQGGSGKARVINGYKICYSCKKKLPESHFWKYLNGRVHSYCNECKKESFRIYAVTRGRFQKYGITQDIFDKMYKRQKGKCFICKLYTKLYIDHDHSTGALRKLLCRNCNSALGFVKDNTKILKNMISYLEN